MRKLEARRSSVTLPKDLISLKARPVSQVLGSDASGLSATTLGQLGPALLFISSSVRSASGKGMTCIYWIWVQGNFGSHELCISSKTLHCCTPHTKRRVKLFLRNCKSPGGGSYRTPHHKVLLYF